MQVGRMHWRSMGCTRVLALLVFVPALGCTGVIGDGASDDPTNPFTETPAGEDGLGASRMLRLTRLEYRNTIGELLGVTTDAPFGVDEHVGAFTANASTAVSQTTLDGYRVEAESLASAVAVSGSFPLPCDPVDVGDSACAEQYVTSFGSRAFRRPLEATEVDRYRSVYELGAEESFVEGIRLLTMAMLQSPHFLYRVEIGTPVEETPGVVALTGYEIASRLSYFLWKSMPDDELFDAASAGLLDDPDGIEAQARRMIADDRFGDAAAMFHTEWLHLGELDASYKDPELFPEFDASLSESMQRETELFTSYVLTAGDGRLSTLFTAPYTFVDSGLAELYGLPTPTGDGFVRVDLDERTRAGIFTQAGPLTVLAHAEEPSVVLRGKFVREDLLCDPLPPPPAGVDTLPGINRLESDACSVCHTRMDLIGQGFDRYDAIGRYRTQNADGPISGQGEIVSAGDLDGTFDGPIELARRLADSPQVQNCMVRQWFRFALSRVETGGDENTIAELEETLAGSDGDLREALIALTTSYAFRHRAATPLPEED